MNRWRLLAVFLFSMVKKRVIIEAAIKGKVDFHWKLSLILFQ